MHEMGNIVDYTGTTSNQVESKHSLSC